ncbi:MAG TPA: hypothetical protein PLT21_09930, partial [Syntrophales bacterium]|nr:hypothetical protein [Syntrophales bacterium]
MLYSVRNVVPCHIVIDGVTAMTKRIGIVGLACLVLLGLGACTGGAEKAGKGEFRAQLKLASLTP